MKMIIYHPAKTAGMYAAKDSSGKVCGFVSKESILHRGEAHLIAPETKGEATMFEIRHEYEGKISEHATKAEALAELKETIEAAAEDTMRHGEIDGEYPESGVDYPTAYKYCAPMYSIREVEA